MNTSHQMPLPQEQAMQQADIDQSVGARAKRAVGEHRGGDYVLHPAEHAASLPAEAGPLKRILMQSKIQAIIDEYEKYDSGALRWQGRHILWGKVGIWSSLIAVTVALTLTVSPWQLPPLANVLLSVGVWGLVCFAWGCFIYLMHWRPQERWLTARANAEELRKRLFVSVLAADQPAHSGEIATVPLQLEYFRRYQYEVQQSFYKQRTASGQKRARQADSVRYLASLVPLIALVLTLAAASSASSEQGFALPALNWLGGSFQSVEALNIDSWGIAAAILVSALTAGLFAIAQLDDYRRNALRYKNTLRRIEEIADDPRIGFVHARAAAEAGDRLSVERLLRTMHAVMSAELAEWVTIRLDGKIDNMPTRSSSEAPMYELRIRPDGATDFVASTKLTPSDFDAIRARVGAPQLTARKVGFASARQATADETIHTRWNGKESSDIARPGDWIVTNMSAARALLRDREGSLNTYVIRSDVFPRLYDRDSGDTEHGAIYRSKSVVEAFQLPGSFELMAPWGELQRGARGYLIKNGQEVYGNNSETFEATYEVVGGAANVKTS